MAAHVLDVALAVKEWLFPISLVVLICYGPFVLIWTIIEGRATLPVTTQLDHASKDARAKIHTRPLAKRISGLPKNNSARRMLTLVIACIITSGIFILASIESYGFVLGCFGARDNGMATHTSASIRARQLLNDGPSANDEFQRLANESRLGGAWLLTVCRSGLFGVAMVFCFAYQQSLPRAQLVASKDRIKRFHSSNKFRHCGGSGVLKHSGVDETLHATSLRAGVDPDFPCNPPRYSPPRSDGISLWHHVDLHVKSWLDEPTGRYRYVNEIPKDALQHFELQTRFVHNIIREDPNGSKTIQAFGRPFPFNYGCFPKTYRDPKENDQAYNAPGDDDPLDVIDLTSEPVAVGAIQICEVVGAVCLADEKHVDYKIFVVSVESQDRVAKAKSIEDVVRLAPGRIETALRWMDEFREFSNQNATSLYYDILNAKQAVAIIEKDHAAWHRLVAEAEDTGTARGHWIKSAVARPVSTLACPPCMIPGRSINIPSDLLGTSASPAPLYTSSSGVALPHMVRTDGSESSEEDLGRGTSSPTSSDAEIGI